MNGAVHYTVHKVSRAYRHQYAAWLALHPEYEPMSAEEDADLAAALPTKRRVRDPRKRAEVEAENAQYAASLIVSEPEEVFLAPPPPTEAEEEFARFEPGYDDEDRERLSIRPPRRPKDTKEPAEWGFDSFYLEQDAERWGGRWESGPKDEQYLALSANRRAGGRMQDERLVLIEGTFKRALCGLTDEPGHRHVRYCAGPHPRVRRQDAQRPRGEALVQGPGVTLPWCGSRFTRGRWRVGVARLARLALGRVAWGRRRRCPVCGYPPGRHNPLRCA